MQIDLEKCTGCGDCLDACPVEAISMNGDRAWIDPETCLDCEACVRVCPVDAICPSTLAVPAEALPISTIIVRQPAELERAASHPAVPLATAALTFAGREILPRVVDIMIGALEKRLSQPEVSTLSNASRSSGSQERGSRCRQRRRRKRSGFRT